MCKLWFTHTGPEGVVGQQGTLNMGCGETVLGLPM